jgi:hypothetical protein
VNPPSFAVAVSFTIPEPLPTTGVSSIPCCLETVISDAVPGTSDVEVAGTPLGAAGFSVEAARLRESVEHARARTPVTQRAETTQERLTKGD